MGRFTLFAVGAGTLLAACGAEPVQESEAATRLAPVEKGSDASTDELFDNKPDVAIVNGEQAAAISVSMPENIDSLHPDLAEELRERTNAQTEAFIASAEADKREAREKGFEFRPHSLDVKWAEVGPRQGRLSGYLGTYSSFTGGAHPNVRFDVLNWDRETETFLSVPDLFSDPERAQAQLAEALKAGLLEAKRERLKGTDMDKDEMMETWVEPAFQDNKSVFRNVTFAPSSDPALAGGLTYHFSPYEVGAYAEGSYTITVPYMVFESELKPDYAESFGGEPVLR